MIKLKDLLKEVKRKQRKSGFDYGDQLFTDPNTDSVANTSKFKKFLKKWQSIEEPNTEDENEFLDDLRSYTDESIPGNIAKVLKILAPLKSKFPGILDPTKSTNVTKFVYRGTTIPINLIDNTSFKDVEDNLEFNITVNIKSKGNRGFLSFSTSVGPAYEFATQFGDIESNMKEIVKKELIPAIICLPISDSNLIGNPDFIINFSPFDLEQETFYLGSELTAKKILIPKDVLDLISDNLEVATPEYKTIYNNIISKTKS